MTKIHSYLHFNGNCREAMTFYKECLGGELTLQIVGESPMAEKMPPQMKDLILHASLTNLDLILLGSDMSPQNLVKGNAIDLMLECSTETEIKTTFQKLSEGGMIDHPLEETFWGATFGTLTDKFGNPWMFNFTKNTNN